MKTYNQLVRLHEYRLHERQKAVSKLEAEAAELRAKIAALEAEMVAEEKRAQESALGSATFANYFRRASERRRALSDSLNELARRILTARMELKRVFDELKRIETLRDRKEHEMAEELKRAEQAELDEVALRQHHRNGG